MKKSALTFIFVIIASVVFGFDFKSFTAENNAFLKKYVANGSVDYKRIIKNIQDIEKLYQQIEQADVKSLDSNSQKAFYINAYNLIVIYWVAKHYPLKSPLDNSGFFDKVKHKVAGEELTLNSVEIKKLLLIYKDARIHFALACAAKSCPPLASFAFTPAQIDSQLDERAKLSLNNPGWLKLDHQKKSIGLSKIFQWYEKDFTSEGTVVEWINRFRKEKLSNSYSINYYEYDWSLNEK